MELPSNWLSAAAGQIGARHALRPWRPSVTTPAAAQGPGIFPKTYASHETVFRAGDEAEWIYEILDGAVALVNLRSNGRRQIIGFAFRGDLIGLAVRNRLLHDSEALSRVTVNRYRCVDLARHCRRIAGFSERVGDMTGDLLSSFRTQVEILRMKSANARVAAFVVSVMRRAPATEEGFIGIGMRRSDIADYLGLTPESVCRAFHEMEKTGAIEMDGVRLLRVKDIAKLLGTIEES
ncbi:MAG: Crp/Fnr family transcriptional regulator [Rhodospirillaceae bacterium]